MAVLHLSPTEIGKMEWSEMVYYHEKAIDFYEDDLVRRSGGTLMPLTQPDYVDPDG